MGFRVGPPREREAGTGPKLRFLDLGHLNTNEYRSGWFSLSLGTKHKKTHHQEKLSIIDLNVLLPSIQLEQKGLFLCMFCKSG